MKISLPRLKIFKYWWGIPLAIFVLSASLQFFLLSAHPAQATVMQYVYQTLASIFQAIGNFEAKILLWLVNFLIVVSGYNNFINARVVQVGWPLVRDVANMFYILIMLVIAFATMLKIEKYDIKHLLPRLIGTAILVNFSKTIIGLLIDFGQVIMLTFVNGYAATAGGNFVTMFGLQDIYAMSQGATDESADVKVMTGFLLGMIVLGVAMIVVLVFVVVLMLRVITLWILIVLSPLAFLLGTFPKGQEHYQKWWKELVNNIIVGPIVAFFLWLSLAVMGSGGTIGSDDLKANNAISGDILGGAKSEQTQSQIGATNIGDWEKLTSFAVSIAMLLMGLSQVKDLGVAGAGLASGATAWMKKTATSAVKKAVIPAAAIGLTGGVVPGLLAMGGMKGTMDVMARMPVIGKSVQKLRKAAEPLGLGESGKIVNAVHKKVGMPVVRGMGRLTGAAVGGAGALATGAVVGAGAGLAKGLGKAVEAVGPKGGRIEAAAKKLGGIQVGDLTEKAAVATYGKAGGLVSGSIVGGTKRMEAGIAAAERGEARKGAANVRELSGEDAIKEATRPPNPMSDVDKQWVFANQSRVLKDPRLVQQLETAQPGGTEKLLASYADLGKSTGNSEESLKVVGDFKKGNLRFNSDTPKPGETETEMARAVGSIHPDNIKNVSSADLKRPEVAKYFDEDQVKKMSKKQLADYTSAGVAAPRPGRQSAEQERALQQHLGLSDSDMGDQSKVQAAVTAKGGLPRQSDGSPTPISSGRFDQLSAGQKVDALRIGHITVDKIDAAAFKANGGDLAGAVASSGNKDLIQAAGAIPEFREGLETKVSSPSTSPADAENMRAALATTARTPDELERAVDYDAAADRFRSPAGEKAAEKAAQSGDMPGLKDIGVDKIVSSFGAVGSKITALGAKIGENITMGGLLKRAQEANTNEEKRLVAALMLAKKERTPSGHARVELGKQYSAAPALQQFITEMRKLEDKIHPPSRPSTSP